MPKLTLCADSSPREDLCIPVFLHTREESPFGDGTTAEHYLARAARFKYFPDENGALLSSPADSTARLAGSGRASEDICLSWADLEGK
jgi:hypothetical protein